MNDSLNNPAKYVLAPSQDTSLCRRMEGETAMRHGAIGYLVVDYGMSGQPFCPKFYDGVKYLKTHEFTREFDAVIHSLRNDGDNPPFASRLSLHMFCRENYRNEITTHGGYTVQTENYSYYFHLLPRPDDYDIYCFVYDNRFLLPELAGQHELPDLCYSTMPSTDELIIVKNGEHGYYPCEYSTEDTDYNRKIANDRNARLGVTKEQEEAMVNGSMFGWNSPAAKPWNYDNNGNLTVKLPERSYESR